MPDEKSEASATPGKKAFKRGVSVDDSIFYMGSIMGFLISGKESGDNICMMEYISQPGNEPPPHIHRDQDEIFFILEGGLQAYCGDAILDVTAGESLFLPRNQAHAWYITSEKVRALIVTQPAGLDDYFRAMGSPADSLELPSGSITYALDDPDHATRVGKKYGIDILTPAQTRDLLPIYPGLPRVMTAD